LALLQSLWLEVTTMVYYVRKWWTISRVHDLCQDHSTMSCMSDTIEYNTVIDVRWAIITDVQTYWNLPC
jgi:hypothetical protein